MTRWPVVALALLSLQLHATEERVVNVSDRERVARRFAPGEASQRRAAAVAGGRVENVDGYVVDGGRDPELLMPWEIMQYVSGAFESGDAALSAYAERWRTRGAAAQLGDDFVPRLRAIMQPILDATSEMRRLQAQLPADDAAERERMQARRSTVNRSLCRLRAQALATARQTFGEERFHTFLYEAVAPDVVIVSTAASSPEATLDLWKWYEEGCR